jgi:hypothetical protein
MKSQKPSLTSPKIIRMDGFSKRGGSETIDDLMEERSNHKRRLPVIIMNDKGKIRVPKEKISGVEVF